MFLHGSHSLLEGRGVAVTEPDDVEKRLFLTRRLRGKLAGNPNLLYTSTTTS
jgi:hypothetical protein